MNATHSDRYELRRMWQWRNRETGATASVFGACPWTSDAERPNWIKESCGWGYFDTRNGTAHGKNGTLLDDAIAQVNAMNLRQAQRDARFAEMYASAQA
jgi:hypothetical protein